MDMFFRRSIAVMVCALASACASAGYAPTPWWTIGPQAFSRLKPGVTSKEEVRRLIGVPLTESHFPRQNEDVWEYRYLDGTLIWLADITFDAQGRFKYLFSYVDPAFYSGME